MTDPARAAQPHIRIGNRTYEAILDSTMSDRQKVICYALLRVTVGWQQTSARLTHDDFADAAGMNPGGTFRAALKELEHESVVEIVTPGGAGQPNEYRLNEDYTRWGRYSVAPERLRRLHGKRPEGQKRSARTQAVPDDSGAQGQAALAPTSGQQSRPPVGSTTGSNPNDDTALDPRKDRKDSEITTTTTLSTPEKGSAPPLPPPTVGLHARRVAITTLEAQYDAERRDAARRWAEDPANAEALAKVEAEAKSKAPFDITNFVGRQAYEAERTRLIASIIGFPTFPTWKASQSVDNSPTS